MANELPDVLANRIATALSGADALAIARTDQLASLWRDFFGDRGLDLSTPDGSEYALRTLTMVYGLAMAAHASGELDDRSWDAVNDIVASGATAVTVLRRDPSEAAQDVLPL